MNDVTQGASGGLAISRQTMALWSESIVAVLESMTAHRPKVESHESELGSTEWEQGIAWWGQQLSVLEKPCFWIGAPATSWTELGRLMLAGLGVEEPTDTDIQATCRDVLAQATATVASRLTLQFGREITGGDSLASNPPVEIALPVFKWSLDAGLMSMDGVAAFSESFLRECSSFASSPVEDKSNTRAVSPPSGSGRQQAGQAPAASVPGVDLLVRFVLGRTTVPLGDIFKLSVGSVIELNHSAIEPAEIVIHGRVFARGQVVVINSNYGLKVLPQEQ